MIGCHRSSPVSALLQLNTLYCVRFNYIKSTLFHQRNPDMLTTSNMLDI
jgi:hypothetical protein